MDEDAEGGGLSFSRGVGEGLGVVLYRCLFCSGCGAGRGDGLALLSMALAFGVICIDLGPCMFAASGMYRCCLADMRHGATISAKSVRGTIDGLQGVICTTSHL